MWGAAKITAASASKQNSRGWTMHFVPWFDVEHPWLLGFAQSHLQLAWSLEGMGGRGGKRRREKGDREKFRAAFGTFEFWLLGHSPKEWILIYTNYFKSCPIIVNQTNVAGQKVEATEPVPLMMHPEFKARAPGEMGSVNLFNFMTCALLLQCYLGIKAAGFHRTLSFQQLARY